METVNGRYTQKGWVKKATGLMDDIFSPLIPAMTGAGLIKALLILITMVFPVLEEGSGTAAVLAAMGNSVFYFLPLLLAISTANALGCNPYTALVAVAALMEPSFTALLDAESGVSLLSIPFIPAQYASTVLPAVLAVFVYARLERALTYAIPESMRLFAVPFLSLMIVVPLCILVVGPLGLALTEAVGTAVGWLADRSGLLAGLALGAGWPWLILFGLHWGVVPLLLSNLAATGKDPIRPMMAPCIFATAGVMMAVLARRKDGPVLAIAKSTVATIFLGGIIEPVLYGVYVKSPKAALSQIIGGGIGGAFMGAMKVYASVYAIPALTTLPAFAGDTFILYAVGITIAFAVSFFVTLAIGVE